MRLTGLRTKRAVVDMALRHLVGATSMERRRADYARRYKELEPIIARIHVSEPPSSIIRRMRDTQ
jgi:Arc/MetJ family transcription regulator